MKRKKGFWTMLILGILIGIVLVLAYQEMSVIISPNVNILPRSSPDTLVNGCEELYLNETATCLNENLKTFFKYNLSNANKKLSFEELEEEGGVCSHYAKLYYNAGDELGFYVSDNIFKFDEFESHENVFISNSEGYCLLDMEHKICFKFRKKYV